MVVKTNVQPANALPLRLHRNHLRPQLQENLSAFPHVGPHVENQIVGLDEQGIETAGLSGMEALAAEREKSLGESVQGEETVGDHRLFFLKNFLLLAHAPFKPPKTL